MRLTSCLLFKVKEFMCWGSTVPRKTMEHHSVRIWGKSESYRALKESAWNQSMIAWEV